MNEVAMIGGDVNELLDVIKCAGSLEELKVFVAKLDGVRVALKKANQYREQSIKFAMLEAEAIMKIVALGGADKLNGYRRKAAEWLLSMTEAERESAIQMCAEGLTIDQVWKREIKDKQDLLSGIQSLHISEDVLIKEVKENGFVCLDDYDEKVRLNIKDSRLATDMVNGIRVRLRGSGAVSLGDGTKVYVMPNSDSKNGVKKAIKYRFDCVCKDLDRIAELAKLSNTQIPYKEFAPDLYEADSSGYKAELVIILARLGVIPKADAQEFMDRILNIDEIAADNYFLKHCHPTKKFAIEYFKKRLQTVMEMDDDPIMTEEEETKRHNETLSKLVYGIEHKWEAE